MGKDQDQTPRELPPEEEYPEPDDGTGNALPRRVESWRRRSATGAILTGFALGLREVLEPERDEPSIMLETSGAPPRDLPVEADLEDAPIRKSVVKVRPWLLSEGDPAAGEDTEAAEDRSEPEDASDPPSGNRTATPAREMRRGRRLRRRGR